MSDVRPVREAENRLAHFNAERAAIVAEVERRVLASRLAAAGRGRDASLEYVLNDVAFQEIRRLERGLASAGERKRIGAWHDLARRLGTMTDDEKRVRLGRLIAEYAHDIAGSFNPRVYRFATRLMPPLLSSLLAPGSIAQGVTALGDLSGKVVIDGPLEHIRACADRGTLVVTPTHSSNMDSVVFGWSLYRSGLPPCTYGAGKNLFTNPFISFFMHNLGAYRVDRRIGNAVYKDVLKTYSQVLLERGYHSLFFPGGTRSRSGSVEKKLKLGLLSTALAAYERKLEDGQAEKRVYVVPATINYALTLEAETLVDDFLAEEGRHRYIIEDDEFSRLGRIVDFSRRIMSLDGSLVIRYGAPLDVFGNAVDERGDSRDQRGRVVDPAGYVTGDDGRVSHDAQRDAEYTRALGDELVRRFRRTSAFMPTNLVARVLFDRIAERMGTRDIYRMLRGLEGEAEVGEVRAGLARLGRALAQNVELGAVADRWRDARPGDILDDALRMFRGYHTRPVVDREGDRLIARDLRLLYYYRNRTAHIRDDVLAAVPS
jgi:glycerol-3-phosphate O-acyltransferase